MAARVAIAERAMNDVIAVQPSSLTERSPPAPSIASLVPVATGKALEHPIEQRASSTTDGCSSGRKDARG